MLRCARAVIFLAILAAIALAFTTIVNADPKIIKASQGVKGCTAIVVQDRGDLVTIYEKAIEVGIRATLPDEPDELWLVFPNRLDNKHDAQGRVISVNWPKSQFLKDGEVRMEHMRMCKCPPFYWRAGSSDISAEQP